MNADIIVKAKWVAKTVFKPQFDYIILPNFKSLLTWLHCQAMYDSAGREKREEKNF